MIVREAYGLRGDRESKNRQELRPSVTRPLLSTPVGCGMDDQELEVLRRKLDAMDEEIERS